MADDGTMRAWRTHEYGEPARRPAARRGRRSRTRTRARSRPRAGDPVQPQRPRAHHRRQHDGAARIPYGPGMEVMGVVDAWATGTEEWLGQRVVAMPATARTAASPSTRSARRSRRSRCPRHPSPRRRRVFFPFHLAWLGLYDRAELQAGETVLIHAAAGGAGGGDQLAVDAGAQVIATAGSDEKLAAVPRARRSLAINYLDVEFAARSCSSETDGRGRRRRVRHVGRTVMEDVAEVRRRTTAAT